MQKQVQGYDATQAVPPECVPQDAVLARRILLRDPDGLAELYGKYASLAYAVILRLVRDPWITQELTQEVFLRVWNSIERFDERRGEFQGWIAAISRNKALDYLRSKNARARRRECPLNKLRDPAKENCLEERIMTEDLVRLSRDVMQQLNEKQRQVFRLTYFEGKTQSEIAAELEAPLGSVKTWARVISKMLRKQGAITPGKVCMCGSI